MLLLFVCGYPISSRDSITSEENESLSQIHSLPEDWSKLTSFQVAVQSLFLNVAV